MAQLGVKCGTCPAFDANEDGVAGKCRGEVPTAFLMTGTTPLGQPVPRLQSAWRLVHADDDWCAKHPGFSWGVENIATQAAEGGV
jgi:hypothetical protein